MIVKPLEHKEEISEGVIIPKTANAELTEALVVMIDKKIEEYTKIGDIVIFDTGKGTAQFIDQKPHLWININDIKGGFSMDNE